MLDHAGAKRLFRNLDGARNRSEQLSYIGIITAVALGLYLSSLHSYLLFHSLIEIITIAIGFTLFILVWNTQRFQTNDYLTFLGISYGFIALVDLNHTLAYKGMNVFQGFDANLPTQLWIAARYLQAVTLCTAPFSLKCRFDHRLFAGGYAVVIAFVTALVFTGNFPDCFIEGKGLTTFKIGSEYVIFAMFLLSLYLLYRIRQRFKPPIFRLLACSILCTMFSELSFTAYISVYGFANMLGHLLKLGAFYLLYRALLVTGFKEPYELIFKDLKEAEEQLHEINSELEAEIDEREQAEDELRKARDELEIKVEERTAELRTSEEKFRRLAENARDVIFRMSLPDGSYEYMSPAAKELFGYSPAEFYDSSKLIRMVIHPDWLGYFEKEWTNLLQGNMPPTYEYQIVHKNGKMRWVNQRNILIRTDDGRINAMEGIVTDITERKKLEEQLRHSQKMEAIGTLTGGIAHDFNNILTAIIGFGSLMEMKMAGDDPLRVNITQILAAADRAANLTRSLLTFSRKQTIDVKPANLNEIVSALEKMLRRLIREDIDLRIRLAEEALTVMADAGQIEQVLINLTTNARDSMASGGSITITTDPIEIDETFSNAHGYGAPGSYALVTFSDSGEGMEESVRKRIFEPFFTTKEVGKGTGLGLSICYGIIKQHGGFINCYSEPGKGAAFRIYLPLVQGGSEKREPVEETPIAGGTETILLAEDDASVRELTTQILQEYGYSVIEAGNGEEAMARFIERPDEIRLCLFDLIMPKKNGRDAYEEITKLRPGFKVLFMSGYQADIPKLEGLLKEGMDFISKPVMPRNLLLKVREILDR